MTRFAAADDPTSPLSDVADRRSVLTAAGAAALLAAIGTPAEAIAKAIDPDAALWALRTQWSAARAAYLAEERQKSPEYAAALAAAPKLKGVSDRAEISRIVLERARILAPFSSEEDLSPEAEARQDRAFDKMWSFVDQFAETPARTLAGIAFKAHASGVHDHSDAELVASIMADVEALARQS